MNTTYTITIDGLDAEQLGDALVAFNGLNRNGVDRPLPVPEVRAHVPAHFDVVLAAAGANKIHVIKAIREITGIGLNEAKVLVEDAPKTVKEHVQKTEALAIKSKLVEVGATVELR